MVILNAVLPELLQREHAANAHFVKDLLHDIRERRVPESSFPIHSKAQQLGELQAVLVGDVCQGLQDALVGTLEACVSQDGGHGLVEKLPAGGPAQLSHRLPFSSVKITLWVTVPQLKRHFGGFAVQRKQVIGERWGGRARGQRLVVFGFDALRLLLVLSLGHGDEAAQPPVVLDELDGVDGEAAGLGGDVQHGGGPGLVGGRLVQRRVLDFHGAKLALKQVEGAAIGLVGRNGNLTPIPQHFYAGNVPVLNAQGKAPKHCVSTQVPSQGEAPGFGQQQSLELGWCLA